MNHISKDIERAEAHAAGAVEVPAVAHVDEHAAAVLQLQREDGRGLRVVCRVCGGPRGGRRQHVPLGARQRGGRSVVQHGRVGLPVREVGGHHVVAAIAGLEDRRALPLQAWSEHFGLHCGVVAVAGLEDRRALSLQAWSEHFGFTCRCFV